MAETQASSRLQDDLIDRLAGHGIQYFDGGSQGRIVSSGPVDQLLLDLARGPTGRLRSALIALLLRHPVYAPIAESVAHALPSEDPAARLLLASVVAAAALQREWGFTLDLYLPNRPRIPADHLADKWVLPPPDEDYGRPCLTQLFRRLQTGQEFPFNYRDDWESATRRLIVQLIREAGAGGP